MPEAVEDVFNEPEKEGPSSIQDLKRKMRLEGTVSRVELYGAFVDVGVGTDGLVHISQLRSERVNRVSDVVKQGDHVTVWVLSSDPSKRRIELTMIEPPAVDWDEVRSGQVYSGTVKRLERFGAFVDIGATRDGLVHISEITSDFIRDPGDYLKVGDPVQVKVLQVDHKRRRIELSMKALEEHLAVAADEIEPEEPPTTIEFAWENARGSRRGQHRQARRKKGRQARDEDDIFSRTLRLRGDQ